MSSNSKIYKEREHIYYNAFFTNKLQNGSAGPIPIQFEDRLSQNLLNTNAQEYELLIQRFQIPLSSVPFFLWDKDPSKVNDGNPYYGEPNNSKYVLSIRNNTLPPTDPQYEREVFVDFIPLSTIIGVTGAKVDLRVYSVQHFIDIINKAFYDCGQSFNPVFTQVPFLVYNNDRKAIDIYAPQSLYTNGLASTYSVRFNDALYGFFNSFEYQYDQTELIHNRLIIKETSDNFLSSVRPPQLVTGGPIGVLGDMLVMRGYYSSIGDISSVRSIIFTSNLPIRNEVVSGTSNGDTNRAQLNILTDFVLDLEGEVGANTRSIQVYNNKGEDRYIDMNGSDRVKNVDIQAYWQTSNGEIIPIELDEGETFTMKLMFRKRLK